MKRHLWDFILGIEGQDTSLDDHRERFNLAVLRIFFFALTFITASGDDYFLQWVQVPDAFWYPRGLSLLLESPPPAVMIEVLFATWRITTLLALFGVFYRIVAPVWWISGLIVTTYGHSFGYQGHVYMPVVLASVPLVISRAGDMLSFDNWRRACGDHGTAFGDRLTIRTVQLVFVLVYFAAGVAKIRHGGWEWISGDTLRNYLLRSSVIFSDTNSLAHTFALNDILMRHPFLCRILAFFAVSIEVCAPLAFFSRRFSRFIVPLIVGLQIGIFFTIYVRFTTYAALVVAWINWHWVWSRVSSLRRAP